MNRRLLKALASAGALFCAAVGTVGAAAGQTETVSANPAPDPEKILADKIDLAINKCAAAYVAHSITTHADAVICTTGPFTKAFQEAGFQDMDLVYEYEGAALAAASKLDHGEGTESDFRTDLTQAMLRFRTQEDQRVQDRKREIAAQQQAQIQQAQARADQEQAAADARQETTEREKEYLAARRQAAIQQIIRNQQIEQQIEQQNASAAMLAISGLMGSHQRSTNCMTTFTGAMASTNCN
jgi:hypothetical protein